MNSLRFSVIIPVYNSKEYIHDCIESLQRQLYDNFEVLLIDDGSTDGSGELCDKLLSLFPTMQIRVWHQNNMGQVEARYQGIRYAKGDYCCFLDSDDTLTDNALDELSKIIDLYSCDVIIFNGQRFLNGDTFPFWPEYNQDVTLYSDEEIVSIKHDLVFTRRFNNLAFKAIKTSILKDSLVYDNVTFIREEEDLLMQLPVFDKVNSVVYLPKMLYNYRLNPTSVTGRYNPNRFLAKAYVLNERQKFAQKWKLEDFTNARIEILAQSVKRTILSLRNVAYNRKLVYSEIRSIVGAKEFRELYERRNSFQCDRMTHALILLLKNKAYFVVYYFILLLRILYGSDRHFNTVLQKKFFSESLNG